ncbi:SDR family oxidoreductase [Nocardia sp. 348MFTsu5.1]|uniref:SDR family NAD(P)-dependent oxidoreductase n=1 Tax=Nocardia sp. 348MFTsu5.1 TaxID=1172185 RepID=UPI0003698993|nr:SDR family oxidoreductase [Nocardia sp. 348MFTsu5.1]
MESLTKRTVVITGAASGIGRSTAMSAARKGANVVVADCDHLGAEAVATSIRATGAGAISVQIDVGDDAAFEVLRDATLAEFGSVDVIMNNAGVLTKGLPEHIPVAEWERVININLMSVVRSNSVFLPLLLEQGTGHMVNTASFAGLFGYSFDRLPYSASKAAIIQLSEGLAFYLKPKGIGVTVLCPGPVATNIASTIKSFGPDTGTRGPGAQFKVRSADEVGEMVVDAILCNRFMLQTDDQVVPILQSRASDWDSFIDTTISSWDTQSTKPTGTGK